ncbi:MAG: ATP-binding cassette domain-containing protein, partial [Gemmatimonadaceae bacterium]
SIIGPNGAGKSTLLRLLVRMEEPQSGLIAIDGTPLSRYTLPDLRRQIAVVWQEYTLMRGTVWDNVTFGLPEVSFEAVEEAMRLCGLDALVRDLPAGYQTEVAEWGANLSGGQRQRIAIARALVRNTPIVILDEATSQIDVESERQLLRALCVRLRGRTVLFATHRLATAAVADRVLVLEHGRLTAQGTHEYLVTENDAYRRLMELSTASQTTRHYQTLADLRA